MHLDDMSRDPHQVGDRVPPPYYFGVHPGWVEVEHDAFASAGWIDHCRASALSAAGNGNVLRSIYRHIRRGGDVPKHLAIPLEEIRRLIRRHERASVLDIGGGYGDNFAAIAKGLGPATKCLSFDVVDNQRSQALGKSLFETSAFAPGFPETIPEKAYDLVTVIGTLHYIEDWQGFVRTMGDAGHQAFYLSRTPLRLNGTSFVTVQSVCPQAGESAGRKVGEASVNVIGWDDLVAAMSDAGFDLERKVHNADYSEQMGRLPEAYRNVAYIDTLWRRRGA